MIPNFDTYALIRAQNTIRRNVFLSTHWTNKFRNVVQVEVRRQGIHLCVWLDNAWVVRMNSLRSPWKEDVEKLNIYAGEKTRRDMEYKEGE